MKIHWPVVVLLLCSAVVAVADTHSPKLPSPHQVGQFEKQFSEMGRMVDTLSDLNGGYVNLCAEQRLALQEILTNDTLAQQIFDRHKANILADEEKLNDLYAQKAKLEGRK